jgi:hypothetical protein
MNLAHLISSICENQMGFLVFFFARGIVAEPPQPRSGEGDGAHSPTRAKRSGSPKGMKNKKRNYLINK